MTRKNKLEYGVYAKHGDCCGIGQHHDVLGCASGLKEGDYELAARFSHLVDAIDYCFLLNGRGVNVRLAKPNFGKKGHDWSDYSLAKSPVRAKIIETRVDVA